METTELPHMLVPTEQTAPNKVLLTVNEACIALSIKRTLLYGFLARGELLSVKVRGRRLIPRKALDEFVTHLIELQKAS